MCFSICRVEPLALHAHSNRRTSTLIHITCTTCIYVLVVVGILILDFFELTPPPDAGIDGALDARLGAISPAHEYVLHDEMIRNISLAQLFPYAGPTFFVLDSRAHVAFEKAMHGFDATQHRLIRWSLVKGVLYPRRVRPTHLVHRSPHLRDFVSPPAHIPTVYLAFESFEDSAQFLRLRSIMHHCLRLLNMSDARRQSLDATKTFFFAGDGAPALRG